MAYEAGKGSLPVHNINAPNDKYFAGNSGYDDGNANFANVNSNNNRNFGNTNFSGNQQFPRQSSRANSNFGQQRQQPTLTTTWIINSYAGVPIFIRLGSY